MIALVQLTLSYSTVLVPRVAHLSPRAPPPIAEAAVDRASAQFDALLTAARGNPAVALRSGQTGRSLVATRDVDAGEALLTVPKKLLLTAHRNGVVGGLQGQTDAMWEATGDLFGYIWATSH